MDGNPYQNVNGEPFDPPPQREILDPTVFITRYEADLPLANMLAYAGTTNTEPISLAGTPIESGKALLYDIQAVDEIAADMTGVKQRFWEVGYEIRFRVEVAPDVEEGEAWYRRVLNQGFYEPNPFPQDFTPPRDWKRIYDAGDQTTDPPTAPAPIVVPKALDANGFPIADSDPSLRKWLYFKEHRSADWTPLGLFT